MQQPTSPPPKRVRLAYGRDGLEVDLPASAEVIAPRYRPALADEAAALRRALRDPLAGPPLVDRLQPGQRVGISVCDVTRPFPAARVLPVLLDELAPLQARVTLFIATGTHRACTAEELRQMLGERALAECAIVQHDALARERHASLGTVPGTDVPVLIEAGFLEQDARLTTGFVEPHFFAGFSGGPKMVAPGLAALETVVELHSARRIGDPRATWGITVGNPVHDPIRAIAERAEVAFNLDVTLNRDRGITAVFSGDLGPSHAAACAFARETAMAPVEQPYDVVVTTNSGYPLDQNLYQSVKGLSAAAQVTRDGGTIILATACADGLPAHGGYRHLLAQADGPAAFLARVAEPGFAAHDQWTVQVQALVQRRVRVLVKSDGLTRAEVERAWFGWTDDVAGSAAACLAEAGPGARLGVLPEGPQTIPYVA